MRRLLTALAWLALVATTQAAVFYDQPTDTIWVVDYPSDCPCTMDDVLAVDRLNGWNQVDYDAATDAFTVRANLHIGANLGADTYFQLGSKAHPNATLVVLGSVLVWPSWIKGANPADERGRWVNRLTMGSPDAATISATIKIASEKGNEHSFYVGASKGGPYFRPAYSGQLHMHHSTITALVQDKAHALGARAGFGHVYLAGDSVHLFDSTISWVKNAPTAYLVMHLDTRVENCVFEHARVALSRYKETTGKNNLIRGCTFRHCETALDAPRWFLVMSDCKFEDNDHNWAMTECKDAILIDCDYAPPKKGDVYGQTDYAKRNGWYPLLKSRRHIVIEVVDEAAKPVPNAVVTIVREQGRFKTAAVTGADGRTPGKGSKAALLLTDTTWRVTDTPNQPVVTECAYDMTAKADGFQAATVRGVRPAASWQVVRIVLRK